MTEKNDLESRPDATDEFEDQSVLLAPVFRTLWSYRRMIVAGVAGVTGTALVLLVTLAAAQRTERIGSLAFRLVFEGAERSTYPNGLPFSAAEIVAAPVLQEVYEKNELSRFGQYEAFKDGVFVLQANEALQLLTFEYQAKLSEPRLTAADRARLEEEFRRKAESLRDPQFSINLRRSERFKTMPNALMEKVLTGVLNTWAEQAAERRGALKYNVPSLSRNILSPTAISSEDYIVGIDIVRSKIERILRNMDLIAELPGSELVRVGKERMSLAEVRASLEDIVRFDLQPLDGFIRSNGLSKDPRTLSTYFENQLFQIKLDRQQAATRVQRLQESLREYVLQRSSVMVGEGQGAGAAGSVPQAGGTPTMIPQFSESFLDRLVEMATQNSDVEYRQKLIDRIIRESLAATVLDKEQGYYEDLNRSVRQLSGNGLSGAARQTAIESVNKRLSAAMDEVLVSVDRVGAIYEEVSKLNLNPSTLLYTKTRPFSVTTISAVTIRTVSTFTLLAFLLSLVFVPVACLVHHYFLREIIGRLRPTAQTSSK